VNPLPPALAKFFAQLNNANGYTIPVALAYQKFLKSLPASERKTWTRVAFSRATSDFVKGRRTRDSVWCFANLRLKPWRTGDPVLPKLVLDGTGTLRDRGRRRTLHDRMSGA